MCSGSMLLRWSRIGFALFFLHLSTLSSTYHGHSFNCVAKYHYKNQQSFAHSTLKWTKNIFEKLAVKNDVKTTFNQRLWRSDTKNNHKITEIEKQAASSKCRWIFMTRCLQNDVLPKSFKTRPVLRSRKGFRMTRDYNKRMLRATRDETKEQYHRQLRKIK